MNFSPLAPTRSRNQTQSNKWTKEEDQYLTNLMNQNPSISWCSLVPLFKGKTAQQIAGRWEKVLNPKLVKGSWTYEEDQIIRNFVQINGAKDWYKLAKLLPGRIGKQCRERWTNHLSPTVTKKSWTLEEDQRLIQLHKEFGNQWTLISKYFEGRTDNCVKNRWNSSLKRRIERIANGEPEYRKRGRKPKDQSTKIIQDNEDNESECGSPIQMINGLPAIMTINCFALPTFKGSPNGCETSISLEENRLNFHNLISRNVCKS
ncbi:Myb-like DNA-binding domain containing protein [Histomonas meleagridis]|uniref:Myb-like DNA-binding domain containing protein n=1 Tax=Histomonas meleagridis TaxID=135588 RepID=UPI00355AB0E3|nr:Myb-like DNA-binding domain containing protein [Histomonas meleagridis]KAH0806816.1 Myb-like DNA-binding domain containing protein [Histomonas meleagridis]